jgi:hypothetical protein
MEHHTARDPHFINLDYRPYKMVPKHGEAILGPELDHGNGGTGWSPVVSFALRVPFTLPGEAEPRRAG